MSHASNNWCFTLNNPTEDELLGLHALVPDDGVIRYIVYQLESGAEGTPHIQGFLQLAKRKRLNPTKEILGPRVHLEKARGSPEQNKTYCTKHDGRIEGPWERGEANRQGKRTDLQQFVEDMSTKLLSPTEVALQFPHIAAKYPRYEARLRQTLREAQIQERPFHPRPGWQEQLDLTLRGPAADRTVHWYTDEVGGTGKSLFANHWRDGHGRGAYVVTGGKHQDIYMGYDDESVVIFDWPRSGVDRMPYEAIEAFKNGYFLSTKYEVRRVRFNIPHVVIFSNAPPDKSKLSADRWDCHVINANPL